MKKKKKDYIYIGQEPLAAHVIYYKADAHIACCCVLYSTDPFHKSHFQITS